MSTQRPPDEPTTLEEWLWRLKQHENQIFVRAQDKDGKWGALNLNEITPKEWGEFVAKWLTEGHLPVRVRTDEEIKEIERMENEKNQGS